MELDNGNNQFIGTDADEIIEALNGRDIIFGGGGTDRIDGGQDADDIFGGDENDTLNGGANSDVIEGGDGDDLIYGDGGNDILRGQRGNDALIGRDGNDTLTGLGFIRQEDIFEADSLGDLIDKTTMREDRFRGDGGGFSGGKDVFNLLRTTEDEGRLFLKGQQYAVIRDFEGGNDKIRLPGSSLDYVARITGDNNQNTAIYYTEDPNIQFGFGIGVASVGTGLSVEIPNETALVAIVENAILRNLDDPMLYEYTG